MKPHTFDTYCDRYDTVSMERSDDGVLLVTLHHEDSIEKPLSYKGSYGWSFPNKEWSYCFYDIARDYNNEVVILTSAGDHFLREEDTPYEGDAARVGKEGPISPHKFGETMYDQTWLQWSILSIGCPVISVIKGEATTHAEIFLHSDVTICSDDAVFQDLPHFFGGLYVPGDGVHVAWPDLLGPNRGSYFLLTGQRIGAAEALELGVVNEVLPKSEVMARAQALAGDFLRRPKLDRRFTRVLTTQRAKERWVSFHGHGLALEGLAMAAREVDESKMQ